MFRSQPFYCDSIQANERLSQRSNVGSYTAYLALERLKNQPYAIRVVVTQKGARGESIQSCATIEY